VFEPEPRGRTSEVPAFFAAANPDATATGAGDRAVAVERPIGAVTFKVADFVRDSGGCGVLRPMAR